MISMADNSVTIALKLDTSQFNSTLAQAKSQLAGFQVSGVGGKSGAGGIAKLDFGARELKNSAKTLEKSSTNLSQSIIYFTSMLKGNFSSFNVAGLAKSLKGLGGDIIGSVGGGKQGAASALAGIEGIGAQGTQAAEASAAALAGVGITVESMGIALAVIVVLLTAILAAVAAIVVAISAVQLAVKPILTILNAIGKVLGAALIPMSMVIVHLLAPLIYMLMPLISIMRKLFAPLQQYINAQLKANVEKLKGPGGFGVYLGILSGAIGVFFAIAFAEVTKALISAIFDALKALASALINVILYMFPTEERTKAIEAVGKFFDAIKLGAINAIEKAKADFIAAITPTKKTKEEAEKEKAAASEEEKSKEAASDPLSDLFYAANAIFSEMQKDAETHFKDMLLAANTFLFADDGSVKATAGNTWLAILAEAEKYLPQVTSAFSNFLNGIIAIANKMIDGLNWLRKNVPGVAWATNTTEGPIKPIPSLSVQDFVMQPGGRVIKTSPSDYIFGTKDATSLGGTGGGNALHVEINVEGSIDDRTARYIANEIDRVFATRWRSLAR